MHRFVLIIEFDCNFHDSAATKDEKKSQTICAPIPHYMKSRRRDVDRGITASTDVVEQSVELPNADATQIQFKIGFLLFLY